MAPGLDHDPLWLNQSEPQVYYHTLLHCNIQKKLLMT